MVSALGLSYGLCPRLVLSLVEVLEPLPPKLPDITNMISVTAGVLSAVIKRYIGTR